MIDTIFITVSILFLLFNIKLYKRKYNEYKQYIMLKRKSKILVYMWLFYETIIGVFYLGITEQKTLVDVLNLKENVEISIFSLIFLLIYMYIFYFKYNVVFILLRQVENK